MPYLLNKKLLALYSVYLVHMVSQPRIFNCMNVLRAHDNPKLKRTKTPGYVKLLGYRWKIKQLIQEMKNDRKQNNRTMDTRRFS
jgi:hypothetical protein